MLTKKELLPVFLIPSLIVSIPVGAMLFRVSGWAWGPLDFILAWVLIAGVVFAYKWISKQRVGSFAYRLATGLGLFAALALLWVNLAVGLIGSEDNPVNAMYLGVLAIGGLGALAARFKPIGMSWTLFAAAAAQLAVPLIALLVRPNDFSPGVAQVFGLNAVFAGMFAVSGWLFRVSANRPGAPITPATA